MDESKGYEYFTNKKSADFAARGEKDTIDEFEVEISKQGIVNALNIYGSHPDNG